MSKERNIFVARGFGWGWMDRRTLADCIADLKKIRKAGGASTSEQKEHVRRAVAILGQFAHDNACDVEGYPMYVGPIGDLRTLLATVDSMEDMPG